MNKAEVELIRHLTDTISNLVIALQIVNEEYPTKELDNKVEELSNTAMKTVKGALDLAGLNEQNNTLVELTDDLEQSLVNPYQ